MIVVAAEVLEMGRIRNIKKKKKKKKTQFFDAAKNFYARHPDGEKSQIFSKLTA